MPRYFDSSALAEKIKSEVLRDMLDGRVPMSIHSFSDLHDFVDANMYGTPEVDNPYIDIPIIDDAQCAVDCWLRVRSE